MATLTIFTLGLYQLFWFYRMYRDLHRCGATKITPLAAVLCFFVPFFNIAWIFIAWNELCSAVTRAYEAEGLHKPNVVVARFAPLVYFIAVGLNVAAAASGFPFPVGTIFGLVGLIAAMCLLQDRVNALAEYIAEYER